jgi:hypothetical protein
LFRSLGVWVPRRGMSHGTGSTSKDRVLGALIFV